MIIVMRVSMIIGMGGVMVIGMEVVMLGMGIGVVIAMEVVMVVVMVVGMVVVMRGRYCRTATSNKLRYRQLSFNIKCQMAPITNLTHQCF